MASIAAAARSAAAAARLAAPVSPRTAAAVAARAAAARHVASDIGRFNTLFPRRGLATGTTLPAAWTRAAAAATPPATRHLRRGLATIHDDDGGCYNGSENYLPLCWFDPEAPIDPATTFNHGEEDLASEEAMWALYERWCVFYGVERDRDDMLRRFDGFKDRARTIYEFNKSGASYTRKLTKRSDMTAEERAEYFRGRPCLPEKV